MRCQATMKNGAQCKVAAREGSSRASDLTSELPRGIVRAANGGDPMSDLETRRQFLRRAAGTGLSVAGLALLGGCAGSPGQGHGGASVARVATIGYLFVGSDEGAAEDASNIDLLRQELRELGWVEGENLRLHVRHGAG